MRWRVRVASHREATCRQTSQLIYGVAHSHLKSSLKSLLNGGNLSRVRQFPTAGNPPSPEGDATRTELDSPHATFVFDTLRERKISSLKLAV